MGTAGVPLLWAALQTEGLCRLPPQVPCWDPAPQGDGAGRGAFGSCRGPEGGAPREGVSALVQRPQTAAPRFGPRAPKTQQHLTPTKQDVGPGRSPKLPLFTWDLRPPEP